MCITTADLTRHNKILWGAISALLCGATIYTLWFGNLPLAFAISQSDWVIANKNWIQTVSEFGKNGFYLLFACMLLYGLRSHKRKLVKICQAYVLSQLLGAFAAVRILKILTGHARPQEILAAGHFQDIWIGPTLDSAFHSFPSGHTADLFVSVIFASFLVKKIWQKAAIISFAVFMGFTRIALAQHFPYDVIVGAVIGTGVSILVVYYWLLPRLRLIDRNKSIDGESVGQPD